MIRRRRGRSLRRRYGHAEATGGSYMVRYVHKISPSDKDVAGPIHLSATDLKDKKSLGAALRKVRIGLISGQSLHSMRVEADGKIVAFPQASVWHALVLTKVGA